MSKQRIIKAWYDVRLKVHADPEWLMRPAADPMETLQVGWVFQVASIDYETGEVVLVPVHTAVEVPDGDY